MDTGGGIEIVKMLEEKGYKLTDIHGNVIVPNDLEEIQLVKMKIK